MEWQAVLWSWPFRTIALAGYPSERLYLHNLINAFYMVSREQIHRGQRCTAEVLRQVQKVLFLFLFLLPLTRPVSAEIQKTAPTISKPIPVTLGNSIFVLSGPWKFRAGDNLTWAEPGFDDSGWESVDLTAAPDAHDADVGLTGYVPGWTAKGHRGYSGYAWYRIAIALALPSGQAFALAGPPDVDDAYQVFFNGRLLGGIGDFSASTPTIYSIQPRMFPLWVRQAGDQTNSDRNIVIAFRVWMGASSLAESSDAGGIHIAPAIGEAGAIQARYRMQWLQTFWGYLVDALEPILFLILAIMACVLIAFDPEDQAYPWLAIALLLTSLVRVNQPLFFWTQHESIRVFYLAKVVVLTPLSLAAWMMTWRSWFRIQRETWIPKIVVTLTLLDMASEFASFRSRFALPPLSLVAFHNISSCWRLLFILILIYILQAGARKRIPDRWLAVCAVLLIATGLFAPELSFLGVPGIWFPYGVGVSRTQFAYVALDLVLFALLLRRMLYFAGNFRRLACSSKTVPQV
jgi:hypothetical protein